MPKNWGNIFTINISPANTKELNNKIDISFNEYRAPQANIDLNASAVNKFIPFDDTTEL